jgi:CheY-like chemotaxis protein
MANPEPTPSATILFVDDDASFLETVQGTLAPLAGGQWDLQLVTEAGQALNLIRSRMIDLAVLDVQMPGTDGLQLLQILKRDFPTLPKVLLTSAPDAATRLAGLEAGAALFLEKPGSLAGMESLYATLNELVKWYRKQDPQRPPRPAGLIEMVRLECASGNSRLIEVFTGDTAGLIYINDGSIFHAEAPGRRGQSAFTYLASHPEATFFLKEFTSPPERSVTRQWEFLVLEAFQLREQLIQAAHEAKRKEATAPPRPSPDPPSSPSHALKDIAAATPSRQPTASAPPGPLQKLRLAPTGSTANRSQISPSPSRPAAGTATAPKAHSAKSLSLQPAPATISLSGVQASGSPHIEEMLVCNPQNEVLYEWRCTRTDGRFRLLDVLRNRTEQILSALPLGPANRIEFQAADARLTVRWKEEISLLIRSNSKQRLRTSNVPPFNSSTADWLASHSQVQGLIACGVARTNRTMISCSYLTDFPSDKLNTLWRATHEITDLVRDQNLEPWLVRWLFERAQLYWMRRMDGRALGLVLTTQPGELDAARVEQMFQEFSGLLEA